jgi:YVTN family beta-propeller protein
MMIKSYGKSKIFSPIFSIILVVILTVTLLTPVNLNYTNSNYIPLTDAAITTPINFGTVSGNFSIGEPQNAIPQNGTNLSVMAYDSENGYLYVAGSSYLYEINKSNQIIKTIYIGKCICWVGYDSKNSMLYLYVTDNISSIQSGGIYNRSIISLNTTDFKTTTLTSFPCDYFGEAIIPQKNEIIFANYGGIISSLNITTGKVNYDENLSCSIGGIQYCEENNYLYIQGESRIFIENMTDNITVYSHIISSMISFIYDNHAKILFANQYGSNDIKEINGISGGIEKTVTCSITPNEMAYDPQNNYLYIYSYNGSIAILNGSTLVKVKTVTVSPFQREIDPSLQYYAIMGKTGEIYIGYTLNGEIISLNGTSLQNTSIISLSYVFPQSVYYDSYDNLLYISLSNGSITVLNPVTHIEIANIQSGFGSKSFALNPNNNYLYISSGISNTVTIVNTGNFSVVKTLNVGQDPVSIIYCEQNADLYVLNAKSWNVSVFTGNGVPVTSIGIYHGYFFGVATTMVYDKGTGDLYISFSGSNSLDVVNIKDNTSNGYVKGPRSNIILDPVTCNIIDGGFSFSPANNETNPISLGTNFISNMLFDPLDQNIFLTEYNSGNISVVNASTEFLEGQINVGAEINSITLDSSTGVIYGVSANSNNIYMVKLSPQYKIDFTETGMNSHISWYVNMEGRPANFSIGQNSESIYLPNGTYSFTVGTSQTYSASPQSGSVVVDGQGNVIHITFSFNYAGYMKDNFIYLIIIAGAVLISGGIYYFWRKRK